MSIQRDENGYKLFNLPDGGQLLWADEDRVLYSRPAEYCTPLTMDPDDEFDELLKAAEYASVERDRLRKELEEAIKILCFYSQQEHYLDEDPGLYESPAICQDGGQQARSFLQGKGRLENDH